MGRTKDRGLSVEIAIDASLLQDSLEYVRRTLAAGVACAMEAGVDRVMFGGDFVVKPPSDPTAVAIRKRVKQIRDGLDKLT